MAFVSRRNPVDGQQALVQHPLMVGPETPVIEAIAQMHRPPDNAFPTPDGPPAQVALLQTARRSCVLIVVDQRPIGIFTERDLVRLSAQGQPWTDQAIAMVMVQPVVCLAQADLPDLAGALTLLQHHGISHLPIVDAQGQVVGLVTQTTLLQAIHSVATPVSRPNAERPALLEQQSHSQCTSASPQPSHNDIQLQAERRERQRREHEIQLFHRITQAISRAEDMDTALSLVVQQVCEALGWAYGEVWLPNADRTVLQIATPGYARSSDLDPFGQAAQVLPLALGEGLPGRVWQTQSPQWLPDLAHPSASPLLRQAVVGQVRLRSAFATPVLAPAGVAAILCFYATEPRQYDPTMVQLTQAITTQLEQIVRRKQLESDRQTAMNALQQLNQDLEKRMEQRTVDLRNSEARFRRLFEQNPVGLAVTNLQGRITRINTSLKKILGYNEAEFLQLSIQDLVVVNSSEQSKHWLDNLQDSTLSITAWETQLRAKHKSSIWATVTSSLILDPFGRPADVMHLIEDISHHKQAEADLNQVTLALQESEEKFRQLAENIDRVFWMRDLAGQILYISPAYETIWQRSVTQLYNNPESWLEALHPDDYDRLIVQVQQNTAFDEEYRIRLPNGEIRWIRDRGFLVRNREGEVYRCAGIAEDISDRKRSEVERQSVEETLRRQLTAIEAAIDGIAILTDDTYTYVNRAHLELFGYQHPEDLVGQTWHRLYSPEELARFNREVFPVLLEKRYWQGEAIAIRQDGSTFTEGLSLTLTDQNELICVCRDITAQKQAALELQQTNERLILSNAELARATRLKDEFLANMSHELRTPMNAILGMAEGLQEQVFGPLHLGQERALAIIERSGRHLLDLINDILDLAKIESGKLELQVAPVSVASLCEASLTFVRQQAIQKNIHLVTLLPDDLPELAVDELRLRQVLINLLNNAVKFTPEGGTVYLEVGLDSNPGSAALVFHVRDTGIGIAPGHLDQLFKPFMQIDSSLTRQHAGTGLGLALVRQLVELHGGTTSVTSTLGQGSCFTVRLPCGDRSPAPPIPSSIPLPPGASVLIIEDMPTATEQISRYLSELGLQSIPCGLGQEALALAQQQPALIILDLMRPDVSGPEVLAQLKADPQTREIPVLITSALEERSQSLAQGAYDYLVKPITREALYRALARLPLGDSPPPSPPLSQRTPLILLAEDNAANLATLSGYLSNRGFCLLMAENGLEAVALTQSHHPDLVVMDMQMPVLDGLSAIRQIRADPATATVPIVALTALAMPNDRDQCLAAGANDYLTKPVRLKTLVEVIQCLLEEVSPCPVQP
jgi:PAS domain S-box-containing protein